MDNGTLGVLNVGAGDTKLSFDPTKPAECERAAAVVVDMLRRGYAIMVQVGERDGKPLYMRAESFDPATCEYLIVGLPEQVAEASQPQWPEPEQPDPEPPTQSDQETSRRRRRRRIHANTTRGVAVAPIAGG